MGSLKHFNLNQYITQHNCNIYVETGTGVGDCLEHATTFPFEQYYTVDIDGELVEKAKTKFTSLSNVNVIHNYSTEFLTELVPNLPPEFPVLFFLDAHFPGADFHKMTYEESIREFKEEAFPLLNEINIIKKHRDISKDVFIIDDWKLYDENLKCEHPEWAYRDLQQELELITTPEKIMGLFSNTHSFKIDLKHQGYLIVTPKK